VKFIVAGCTADAGGSALFGVLGVDFHMCCSGCCGSGEHSGSGQAGGALVSTAFVLWRPSDELSELGCVVVFCIDIWFCVFAFFMAFAVVVMLHSLTIFPVGSRVVWRC